MIKLPEIARKTLEEYFKGKEFDLDDEAREYYKEKRACFVTLTFNGQLRGCVGSLEARQELWKDVQENAVNSAFFDLRFLPVTKEELKKIKIEISVLSKPEKLEFRNENDLLKKINDKMGIILEKNRRRATFLPQVWEQVPEKKDFLEQLSMKAGLDKNAWRKSKIYYYRAEIEKE